MFPSNIHFLAHKPISPNSDAATTQLSNGDIFMSGGCSSADTELDELSSVNHVYCWKSGSWREVAPMLHPRFEHTVTQLNNGCVMVAGGRSIEEGKLVSTQQTEIYDPVTDRWREGPLTTQGRFYATTLKLQSGALLLFGWDVANTNKGGAELYLPEREQWMPTEPMLMHGAGWGAVLAQGELIVMGGGIANAEGMVTLDNMNYAEQYSFANNSWQLLAKPSVIREYYEMTALRDGRLMISGGRQYERSETSHEDYGDYKPLSTVEIYTPSSNCWEVAAPMSEERAFHRAVALESGLVAVVGGRSWSGWSEKTMHNTIEFYNPELNRWSGSMSLQGVPPELGLNQADKVFELPNQELLFLSKSHNRTIIIGIE